MINVLTMAGAAFLMITCAYLTFSPKKRAKMKDGYLFCSGGIFVVVILAGVML